MLLCGSSSVIQPIQLIYCFALKVTCKWESSSLVSSRGKLLQSIYLKLFIFLYI